jgi:hypothetical protein
MNISFVIIFNLVGLWLSAQCDSIVYTYYPNRVVYEEYKINCKDSVKNGYYKRYTTQGKILTQGVYKNGTRIGIWIWYANKEARVRDTIEKYNYDTHVSIFYKDTLYNGPRYPGGMDEFIRDVVSEIKIPDSLMAKYNGGKITPVFKLNCDGNITNIKFRIRNEAANNDQQMQEIIKAVLIKKYPLWIPCKDTTKWNEDIAIAYEIPFIISSP